MEQHATTVYRPKHPLRIVTAASLFDGHDAAINIMRRIMQSSGAEVIHLGHDRSVQEVVECAVQEDAQAIAMTSYQGGHIEYFRYMRDLLAEARCEHIKIFGGGGGVILPDEIEELHRYGIEKIYSPDDGRTMGLQGMINDLLERADVAAPKTLTDDVIRAAGARDTKSLAQLVTAFENAPDGDPALQERVRSLLDDGDAPILGITGTGGAGKSSLVDELVRRFLTDFSDGTIAIVSIDPSKRRTGGALLGDRIRMNAIHNPRVYMRSLATRQQHAAVSHQITHTLDLLSRARFDLIILETSGIGQADTQITDHADFALYVMTPEFGAATQLEKIDMLDFADMVAINKFDKRGAEDALRAVEKQLRRNQQRFDPNDMLPVFGTVASQFNDVGVNVLYRALISELAARKPSLSHTDFSPRDERSEKINVIPPARVRYLSEISDVVRNYNSEASEQADIAEKLQVLQRAAEELDDSQLGSERRTELEHRLKYENRDLLRNWPDLRDRYRSDEFVFTVRNRELRVKTHTETLSGLALPKVCTPNYRSAGDTLYWLLQENLPGHFPYTSGVFPFKREGEDPTRMFAGEGGPERTNRRFHYVSADMPAKRLSTAFDSVTLYGRDPDLRPDIYGKVGNSGVSVCCLDDAKRLYSGFDLSAPNTSVSMTINGPAPVLMAFFLNAAIDQQCEKYILQEGLESRVEKTLAKNYSDTERPRYRAELPSNHDGLGLMLLGITGDEVLPRETYERIKADTLSAARGTVQADILKEDQAQNTCIFSTEFSLKLMGDVQAYFIEHNVRNFYSVSVSGYHIAEAGANPISQLAFTLANGFTYVEYYLARGMKIDHFAPNLSFFFSNGMDPEYSVLGRVARRIWAKAMREKYGAGERSQKLKYHIQTSGRSLHAQEIAFNDIRTTLQALYAIYDNCNSLHTNAYDEAITTPTEESVRRAVAIQLIINHELGLAQNQNPLQGSFIIEELTDLVEEAVLSEFDRITERGGVLGAMETMYQRGKIQDESLHYETLKHDGRLPVIGVNTFLAADGSPTRIPNEVIRANDDEKKSQVESVATLHGHHHERSDAILTELQSQAIRDDNVFSGLMEATKICSLGQITEALFKVGGQYRRSM